MVSISTHATPSPYTSCGQQHNNKATSLQISSASSQAMILSLCEYSAHPLLSVTAQVASASLFKNCLYRFRSTLNVHPQGYFWFFFDFPSSLATLDLWFYKLSTGTGAKASEKKGTHVLIDQPHNCKASLDSRFQDKSFSLPETFCGKTFL